MKIAFVGGGSVQWTPKLVADMALTGALAGATLVLHDIDERALALMKQASEQIIPKGHEHLRVVTTTDRAEALRDATFVILCVSIGGLAAMRNDLEIPQRYGIAQSVGDTVGPGGLARGLRHIPFAVQLAQEMERLCPDAWLLNLTNPMTTICRAVTRASSIRTIGLCHEVHGVREHLAAIMGAPPGMIELQVAGINHLPVLLNVSVDGRDGLRMLRQWLAEHGPFALVDQHDDDPLSDVFHDRLAVKLTLLDQLGVLFGAGDRHVAEFFPNFLTETSKWGKQYGVELTTIPQRNALAQQRRGQIEREVAEPNNDEMALSDEQLTAVMAALTRGPSGQFVINIPNNGQIANLPNDAVVECGAVISPLGVQPLAVGALPTIAHAVIAPHVARQELIVEAALSGRREPALAALATDPLVRDPATVSQLLDDLMAANAAYSRNV